MGFSLDATTSSYPTGSVAGREYALSQQPDVGFIWDGAAPTQFFRNNGGLKNGFAVESRSTFGCVVFHVDFFALDVTCNGDRQLERSSTINFGSVPEPSAFLCGGLVSLLAICGYGTRRRLAVS